MKIASHVLYFNQDKWILKHIEMIAPFVDKIYVGWSELPWTYNPNARNSLKNGSSLDFLKQSEHYDKIEIISGTWNLDEEERNSCLAAAKRDGMDFMFIIDADEFYHKEDIANMIKDIENEPNFDTYNMQLSTYWKDFDHVLVPPNGNHVSGSASVAINVNRDCKFIRCRATNGSTTKQLPYVCFHGSYVLTDEELLGKLSSWGHAHQFNINSWFKNKWQNWTEDATNLHPISPSAWHKAIRRPEGVELPEIIKDFDK